MRGGCSPASREPDNLDLVRVLGVDGSDPIVLSAVCGKDSQQTVSRGKASGTTLEQAREAVLWSGRGKELALTGVSYLVVGSNVDLDPLLLGIMEDADLGASATVWWAETGAEALLNCSEDPYADLELLTLQGIRAPTVAQALAELYGGGQVMLPCLKEESGRIKVSGMQQWRECQ